MSAKLHSILQQQRELLDSSPEAMKTSSFVFPGPAGGQRKLHSYIRHFRRMRDLAGIPEDSGRIIVYETRWLHAFYRLEQHWMKLLINWGIHLGLR